MNLLPFLYIMIFVLSPIISFFLTSYCIKIYKHNKKRSWLIASILFAIVVYLLRGTSFDFRGENAIGLFFPGSFALPFIALILYSFAKKIEKINNKEKK